MASRLIDRTKKSSKAGGSPQVAAMDFGSDGVSEGSLTSAQIAAILREFPEINEVGQPGLDFVESTAGNATHTVTVPAGKYWRLIGAFVRIVADANAANRLIKIDVQDTTPASIEAQTHAAITANNTGLLTTLFGTDDYVRGDAAVAAQGTLSMATIPTAADTIVLNGVTFTYVAALTEGNVNEILLGANVAATQAAMEAAFTTVGRATASTLHSVSDAVFASLEMTMADFAANDAVFTATVKGKAGNSLATTETFTPAGDVFDAATLGTTTAGVDAALTVSAAKDMPDAGNLLGPGESVKFSCTNGVAGDAFDTYLFYLEYDADPTP